MKSKRKIKLPKKYETQATVVKKAYREGYRDGIIESKYRLILAVCNQIDLDPELLTETDPKD